MLSDIKRPVNGSVVKSIWRSVAGGSVVLPQVDYILWLGSSTPQQTSQDNPVLGRQEQALRAKFCAAGIDVPIISKAVGGQTTGTLLSALPGYLTGMGNAVANGKKVGVLVNVGTNDIGTTDYDAMAPATRDTMLSNLNSIITQIETAGMIPILATSHPGQGYSAIYEEWADKMYRPLIQSRCPDWYKAGLAVFDYCRLYTINSGIPNWYQGDGLHPNVATGYYQDYTAAQFKANAECKPADVAERYIFAWSNPTIEYIGGINLLLGAASGTFAAGTVRNTNAVINASASFSWSGAAGGASSSRGNSGVWDIGLENHRIQSANIYQSAAPITFTANFGAGYAGRTGKLRATGNSSNVSRFTQITVGAQSAVINASTGISIVEIPFTLNGSGQMTITASPYNPSTFANVNGIEIEFS